MEKAETTWTIDPEPATKAQRHALYRLGYSRWIVHQLSKAQAAEAIAEGLKRMAQVKADK